jgi:heme exporter protein D
VSLAVWIAIAVAVLSLVLLAWAGLSLLGRVRPLLAAVHRLEANAQKAQALQAKLEGLQPKILELNMRAERVSARR